jgi:tetratricopeptide (TPR) repeat protein
LIYNNLAITLNAQGKYRQAQTLLQKVVEINRRLLTDLHPFTASAYNSLAMVLYNQGNCAAAHSFYQKALEINRHLLRL